MTDKTDEIGTIKTNMALLSQSVTQLSNAQTKSIEVQTNLAVKMGDLLMEMKERDLRDGFLREKILQMEERQKSIATDVLPVVLRAKASQDGWDKLKGSVLSTWGKVAGGVILLAIAYALGLDLPFTIRP